MIYGNISNLGNLNTYPKVVAKALGYLRNKDFFNIDPGIYEIEGKDFYYSVSNSKLDIIENKKPESHNKYLDIQISIIGGEIMGFAADTGNNTIIENLLAEKDILYYKSVENEKFIKMSANDFFVFFPWDIHRPGCTDEIPNETRKVIVKIKYEDN